MQKLSKFKNFLFVLFSLFTIHYSLFITPAGAQVPQLRYPCDGEGLIPEFHSLRPYQAAACGDANKAKFCSNEIQFVETFKFDNDPKCQRSNATEDYWCTVNHQVDKHDLTVELDESELPIMGNTQDSFDDATKLNEYASWYLSGVNGRAETGEVTDDQTINFSGPIKKLIPSMIQEAERIKTIKSASESVTYTVDADESDQNGNIAKENITGPLNHDQIVICEDGKTTPCAPGKELRLKDWNGDLSFFRIGALAWDKRTPPLPWDDGTSTDPDKPTAFKSQILYQKAYNEWLGKSCLILPIVGLQCIDNPLITNTYADLYQYIPLSNTTDKMGANFITGDGPDIQGAPATTKLDLAKPNQPQFKKFRNAPLYFSHMQEVKESSELLNKTYLPADYESEPISETTEVLPEDPYTGFKCSNVNIRVNEGDNLFPGDPAEMQVLGIQYTISEVLCKVTMRIEKRNNTPDDQSQCPGGGPFGECEKEVPSTECNAEVYITLHTGTKTPWADEIFATTVADSGSTFRKIFPKIEEGAPVSCIADIPTVTKVNYEASIEKPTKGTGKLNKITKYPQDGGGGTGGTELTFPHIGSVYEYFLKGIQTALRPKGYGEPIYDGVLCKTAEKAGEDVCATADKYGIPCCQLKGVMELETGSGKNTGSESCRNFKCCHGQACGPAQILCGQYDQFNGGDNLDLCSLEGSAELLSRAMLLKLCQADGKCNSYDWKTMKNNAMKYKVEDNDYTAACYFYGLQNGCFPTACSQYRWGPGISYGDRVDAYCKNKPVPDKTSPQFCAKCNEEIVRAGQSPIQCSGDVIPVI